MVRKILFSVLFLSFFVSFSFAAQPIAKTDKSGIAADFTLPDLQGNKVSLSDYKGKKPVILFFWASWCPHCRHGIEILKNMTGKLSADGVEILAINIGESKEKVLKFANSMDLKFKILLDLDSSLASVYSVMGIPTYFILNKEGRINFNDHYMPENNYKDYIK
ncbi:TlpA family protein disulfide reductase [bacterium]|nr:MAG: TlpA family protein disulfide reductase [bacterium]